MGAVSLTEDRQLLGGQPGCFFRLIGHDACMDGGHLGGAFVLQAVVPMTECRGSGWMGQQSADLCSTSMYGHSCRGAADGV